MSNDELHRLTGGAADLTDLPPFALMQMFPAFEGTDQLTEQHVVLLELCARIGIPFPAERNRAYGNWWHSLHEIGHWAVKPDWYIDYSRYLLDDLHTTWGSLTIPSGTVPGVDRDVFLPRIGRYVGGNDVIPEIALLRDPTPGEEETRVWSLQVIEMMDWAHPFRFNLGHVKVGDDHFHKPGSARVWLAAQVSDPRIAARMERWGLNAAQQRFRPYDAPDGAPFELPFPRPERHEEMMENVRAIHTAFGDGAPRLQERIDWKAYLAWRWPDSDLQARAARPKGPHPQQLA